MLKINKLALVVLTILTVTPLILSGQQRTYSPLSRYGLGESQIIGYGATSGMGTTGIGMRSAYGVNNLNVASLTALDSMSFYFDGGLSYFWQSQDTNEGAIDNSDMAFDYIALAFSVTPRISYTVGFKPVSGTGYKFLTTTELEDKSNAYSELSGSGNLTQAYLGMAVKVFEPLSLGANVSYLFGNLRNISKASFGGSTGALNHGIYNELRVSSVIYDFGAQYTHKVDDEKSLTVGVTYRPKIALKGESTSFTARGTQFGDDNNLFNERYPIDTLRYDKSKFENGELEYASSYGFGLSYVIQNKLSVGADYSTEAWGDAKHLDTSFGYKNTSSYAVGAEFIPNDRSSKNYLARVRYRAGAYYRDRNVAYYFDKVDDLDDDKEPNKINGDYYNYGITFGLGLPLKRSKTSVNLSVDLGTMDSNGDGNYKQSYGKVTANFSLHELWFFKRQFD